MTDLAKDAAGISSTTMPGNFIGRISAGEGLQPTRNIVQHKAMSVKQIPPLALFASYAVNGSTNRISLYVFEVAAMVPIPAAFCRHCLHLLLAADAKKLNVLFLMSDDMRPELGCYGNPSSSRRTSTPWRRPACAFDRAYCQYPLCNPSRTSLLTGRHPTTTGVLDNTTCFGDAPPDLVTPAAALQGQRLRHAARGKIFHGGIDDTEPGPRAARARRARGRTKKSTRRIDSQAVRPVAVVLEGDGESHGDYKTADRAIEYLRQEQGQAVLPRLRVHQAAQPADGAEEVLRHVRPGEDAAARRLRAAADRARRASRGVGPRRNGDLFIGRDATPRTRPAR